MPYVSCDNRRRPEPLALPAFAAEVADAAGSDTRVAAAYTRLQAELRDPGEREGRARRLVEGLALLLQAALLVRHGDAAVADAFCAGRLGADRGTAFGTLPAGIDVRSIARRALPADATGRE